MMTIDDDKMTVIWSLKPKLRQSNKGGQIV